jgi:hypothetical protein
MVMPLIEHILTILVAWWLLSLLFHRISSPLRPVVRWGKKWSSRGWHGFWKNTWDLLYRNAAKKRGPAYGVWWFCCIAYGFFAVSVLQSGQGYDRLFLIGLGLALFQFLLHYRKKPTHRPLPLRRQRRFRR